MLFQNTSFEGSTVAVLCDHFNQWATTTLREEQGIRFRHQYRGRSGWYNFFVTVDQEALVSVLNVKNDLDETGFVRLVEAGWEPEVLDEE